MSPSTSLLDDILEKYVGNQKQPSGTMHAVGFMVKGKNGDTLYSNAVGKLNFGPDSPSFALDSVCWVASLAKLVTAVSVMQLVERDTVGLDDDVGKVVSELSGKEILNGFDDNGTAILRKSTKPITLRNLLTHSSGFCYDHADPQITKWSASVGRTVTAQSGTIEGIKFPLLFEPGDGWMYGVGCDWAGRIVEVLSGCSLEEYTQRYIFGPLGMSSTTFQISEHPELISRRAAIGFRSPQASTLSTGPDPAPKNPEMASGGSGLFTTTEDYAKLLAALVGDSSQILKPESVEELFRPQLDNPSHFQAFCDGPFHDSICPEFPRKLPLNFGLGGAVNLEDVRGKRRKGSMMWSGLTQPHWWIDPKTGIAATLFTQILPFGDASVNSLYDELERAVYQTFAS